MNGSSSSSSSLFLSPSSQLRSQVASAFAAGSDTLPPSSMFPSNGGVWLFKLGLARVAAALGIGLESVNNIASSNTHITWYPRVGLAILGRCCFRCLKSWYFFAFALSTGPLNLEFSCGIRSGDVMNMVLAPVMSSFW